MNAPERLRAVPDRDPLRPMRYVVRVPLLVLHLLVSLPLTLLTINAFGARIKLDGGESLEHRMIRWWQGTLMRIFGFRVARRGEPVPGAALLVANHLSWLDITMIHSQRMACFVAKSEIARWPLVGWMATRGGTIFHRRGSTESLANVAQVMVERLRCGDAVAVFPEGGTGPGDRVRTFHARIFQAAIDAGVPAQPVALRFLRGGEPTHAIAFRPNERFLPNFLRLLGEPPTTAEVIFLEPVPPEANRRRMAEAARARIVSALGFVDAPRAGARGAEISVDELDPVVTDAEADFHPRGLLRNPHVQSVLASSALRRFLFRARQRDIVARSRELILDCGDGVKLQAFHARQAVRKAPRGLVVILHGWEGSANSSYVLNTGERLLREGFDVVRLNFRDHGETHHLNREIFHSCRIDEVVGAVGVLARQFAGPPFFAMGYSLGGNFALRLALRAPGHGIPLRHAFAICPAVRPRAVLESIERAPWFYDFYFMQKWRSSIRRKASLFPQDYAFDKRFFKLSMREFMRELITRYTEFETVDAYLDGYSIHGDRLATLEVPSTVLTARDDPIIPVADFESLAVPACMTLEVARHGGHCGFIQDWSLESYAEDWLVARLRAVARLVDSADIQRSDESLPAVA